jgi:predicted  nucleic acid-binding Zn-ribbon protein
VRDQLLKLCELQQLDIEIGQRDKALAGLDDGSTARAEAERLISAADAAALKRKETEKEYFDHDIELKGIEEKKKKAENLMYSGKVGNPKELADLQKEVAMFNKQIDKLSTRVLELMDEQEACQKNEAQSQSELKQAQRTLEEILERYEQTSSRLKEETATLKSQREAIAQTVQQNLLRRYEQIRSKQGVLAVVALKNEVCDGCHVSIPSHLMKAIRASQSLQTCESCGRLLIWAGKVEEDSEEPEEEE